jgi:hypothetical protein
MKIKKTQVDGFRNVYTAKSQAKNIFICISHEKPTEERLMTVDDDENFTLLSEGEVKILIKKLKKLIS